jgi:hypothetical protein
MRNRPHILHDKVVDSKMAISREQIKATKYQPTRQNIGRPFHTQSNNRAQGRQAHKASFSLSEFLPNL